MNQKTTKRHYFVFAGESSGDLHGGSLLKTLKQQNPNIRLTGVAGPSMREQGIECFLPMEAFQVMGFTDVIASFPTLYRQFYQVRDAILQSQPDCVILIDYPGFNLRLAKALRKKKYSGKIVQMISPTVWAWGKDRINTMTNTLDLLLTIYPFEKEYFSATPLKVEYIGHPLVEGIQSYRYQNHWQQELAIPSSEHLIALFPGSREGEIQRNLPLHLEAAALYKKAYPDAIFGISCVDEKLKSLLQSLLKQSSLDDSAMFFVPRPFTYELMRDCQSAIAKSGTVTLELALHNKPTVVNYRLSTLNRLIAEHILRVRLPHYCIVNILGGKRVFPEWIEKPATPESLFHDLEALNADDPTRTLCLEGCQQVRQKLGSFNTGSLAAKYIEELFLS